MASTPTNFLLLHWWWWYFYHYMSCLVAKPRRERMPDGRPVGVSFYLVTSRRGPNGPRHDPKSTEYLGSFRFRLKRDGSFHPRDMKAADSVHDIRAIYEAASAALQRADIKDRRLQEAFRKLESYLGRPEDWVPPHERNTHRDAGRVVHRRQQVDFARRVLTGIDAQVNIRKSDLDRAGIPYRVIEEVDFDSTANEVLTLGNDQSGIEVLLAISRAAIHAWRERISNDERAKHAYERCGLRHF